MEYFSEDSYLLEIHFKRIYKSVKIFVLEK